MTEVAIKLKLIYVKNRRGVRKMMFSNNENLFLREKL